MDAKAHGAVLYAEASKLPAPFVAVLHDDDWWGTNHIGNGLSQLEANPDAVAYWSTSFLVEGESSWFVRCWNISCWMAAGFPPLSKVAKLNRKQAALACIGSAAAHYSSLLAQKNVLVQAFSEVTRMGNLLDNDRLVFLELARRGSLLVNFVPEVFVRKHATQQQRLFSSTKHREHGGTTTRAVLKFCEEEGIDVMGEFAKLYDSCPVPAFRSDLMDVIAAGVMDELRRHDARGVASLLRRHRNAKWYAQQWCPPIFWEAAGQIKAALQNRSRSGPSPAAYTAPLQRKVS